MPKLLDSSDQNPPFLLESMGGDTWSSFDTAWESWKTASLIADEIRWRQLTANGNKNVWGEWFPGVFSMPSGQSFCT